MQGNLPFFFFASHVIVLDKRQTARSGDVTGGIDMAYQKFTGTYHSCDHINRVHYYIYEPETDLRAILQIVHDFGDSVERNEDLIRFFTDHGVMICGCDHIGHGRSARKEDYGFFGNRNGWTYLVKDMKKLTHYMKREYPDIPYFVYGHGLGSLIVRLGSFREKGINGIILSGTSGRQRHCKRKILFASFLKRMEGAKKESRFLKSNLCRKLNRRFRSEQDHWSFLAADEGARKEYSRALSDKITLTVAAYEDIFKILVLASTKKKYEDINQEIPILLISGAEDSIGNFGKGVEEVRRRLEDTHHHTMMKLYEGMRHNITDEPGKEMVFYDMLEWMKGYIAE